MSKYYWKKCCIFMILFFLIAVNFTPMSGNRSESFLASDDDVCYGFIVPLPEGDDTTVETFENSKVRRLINDLLRENISVYWSSESFSAEVKIINTSFINNIFFEMGTFIIPFSGDLYLDSLMTVIICDYNQTSEIEKCSIKIKVFELTDTITVQTYRLVEPSIAQHFGTPVRYGWPFYLEMAEAGGFYSMELLLDEETSELLNTDDFNVFVWPYNPKAANLVEVLQSLSNNEGKDAIRRFIREGGSYVGSCYGALAACSGMIRPIPLFSLRYFYNPDLLSSSSHITLSLSDSLMSQKMLGEHSMYISTVEIEDMNHPISYGLNKTVHVIFNGPWFVWLGQHTKKISTTTKLTPEKNASGDQTVIRAVTDAPNWVESEFGEGKVILFSSHPEFVNNLSFLFQRFNWEGDKYYGRRVIHNVLQYATSKGAHLITPEFFYQSTYIENLGEKTLNLPINANISEEFTSFKLRIQNLNANISQLRVSLHQLEELITSYEGFTILINEKVPYPLFYTQEFSSLYTDYNNKTLHNLENLEKIYPMTLEFTNATTQDINQLESDLTYRFDNAETLIQKINELAISLILYVNDHQILKILTEPLRMLRTYAIVLKYLPQATFETQKMVNYCWYFYESNVALSTLK